MSTHTPADTGRLKTSDEDRVLLFDMDGMILEGHSTHKRVHVDALSADYHPPLLLAGVFVDTGEPLYERVARVSADPADAVGFSDRGRIEPDKRGDLVVVDPDPTSTVTAAFVAGRPVYRAYATREEDR